MAPSQALPEGVEVTGSREGRFSEILTPEALGFLAGLHRALEVSRQDCLQAREERQHAFDDGVLPDFLPETRHIRQGNWNIAPIPRDLLDRRVEITAPPERKMLIDGLNSGAKVFVADFEDACSPVWENLIEGQINLKDRWDGGLEFTDPASAEEYGVEDDPAVVIVRPRGLHLPEGHVLIDGQVMSGSIFDFGLYMFHCGQKALAQGSGPYFYIPKLQGHLEARLWNEAFIYAQARLGLSRGTIRATVLIETLPAAFEMEEILYELKEHVTGLNCGRWDYIFSFIKTFSSNAAFVLPDRAQLTMDKGFPRAYSRLLIETCHKRGAFAIGGMAAQIPIEGDEEANEVALAKVRADKEREAAEGLDGTWVAHPALVPVAMEVFDRLMPEANQLARPPEDEHIGQTELLEVPDGTRTQEGLCLNIRVGIRYIEAWLGGRGAVPLDGLMEDMATAEISRAQVWQWLKLGARLDDTGDEVTPELVQGLIIEEMEALSQAMGADYDNGRFADAIEIFRQSAFAEIFIPFLTLPAYRRIR